MDVVILAGGYGTRMWPISSNLPKMLFSLGEETVLDSLLRPICSDERVETVYLSTNSRFVPQFESHLSETEYEDVRVSVEETRSNEEKLGAVGGLGGILDRESHTGELVVLAGDNVFGFDFGSFLDAFETSDGPMLAVHDVGTTERARNYGVVELSANTVVDLVEKPAEPETTLVSVGCYGFTSSIREQLHTYLESDSRADDFGSFVRWLVARETVTAFRFDEPWFDVGSPESYREALAWSLDGQSFVAESASVTDAELGDNTVVCERATVEGSRLMETVVLPGGTVRNSELRRSVVAPESAIDDKALSFALIGYRNSDT